MEDQIINIAPEFDLITDLGHSDASKDLVMKLLQKDRDLRLDVDSALKHSWFNMNFDERNRSLGQHEGADTAGFFEAPDVAATSKINGGHNIKRKLER